MRRLLPVLVLVLAATWASGGSARLRLAPTPAEKEALSSSDLGKHTRAREQAEKILDEDPESIVALFVMVEVFYEHEANLPRALFLVRKARRLIERDYGERPDEAEAQRWHRKLLKEESQILGEMDLRQEQLDVLVHYDDIYQPSIEAERIWPLMKLGRFDDAREIGRRLIYSDDFNTRLRAYNGLMAVADETRTRDEGYRWGKEALEKTQEKSCVIAANLARAAMQNFLYDESEEYVKIAKKAEQDDCSSNPLIILASIHLLQGEYQKTVSSFEQLRREPFSQRMRVQFEMYKKGRLAELLYALGQFEEAEKRMTEIIEAPDRVGMTSASPENAAFSSAVLYWTIMAARREQERERAAVRDFADALRIRARSARMAADMWEKSRMALQLATQQGLLVTSIRPYYLDVMPWYAGSLVELLGPGVVVKATEEARGLDSDFEKKAGGYFDALRAEALWRRGERGEAERLAQRALAGLPKKTRLLRLRTLAILADLARENGDREAAQRYFHEVLSYFPTALRHLRIALPVTVTHGAGARAVEAARRLLSSPRLLAGVSGGFEVAVEEDARDGLTICLVGSGNQQYGCVAEVEMDQEEAERRGAGAEKTGDRIAKAEPPVKVSGEERLLWTLDRFHDQVFAPRVELTQSDLNTLDGRTGRIRADEALKEIIGEGGK